MVSHTITPAEQATWHITSPDGADRDFRRDIFRQFPDRFQGAMAKRYLAIANTASKGEANLFLLDVKEKLTGQAIRMASSDDDLRLFAKRRSENCLRLNARQSSPEDSYLVLSQMMTSCGLTPPLPGKAITVEGAVARMCDERWWRRAIRRTHGRNVEAFAIRLGLVHKRAGIYASEETVTRKREQNQRTLLLLRELEAINEDGEVFTLEQLRNLSVSNPKNRRAELMVRLFGFEAFANKYYHKPEFYTLTCPSRMHARYAKSGDPVPNYDGTTPKEANEYLNTVWSRIRARLARLDIRIYGMRVCEPMHDGTPHVHFLLYVEPEHRESLRAEFRHYALQEDGNEPGAEKHRFAVVEIDPKKGTATSYIAKYISKNIDGYGLDCDLYGRDAVTSAERVKAWASTWGIRQFQQIGSPPVTIWRELRRLGKQSNPQLEEIRQAADSSDWMRFIELMGGPYAPRKDLVVKLKHAFNNKPNQYGEPIGDQIIGFEIDGTTITRPDRHWDIIWNPGKGRWETGTVPAQASDYNCTHPGPGSGTGPEPFGMVPGSSGPSSGIVSESSGPSSGNIRKYSEKKVSPSLEKGKPGASPNPVPVTDTVTGSPLQTVTDTVPEQGQPGTGPGGSPKGNLNEGILDCRHLEFCQ